MVQARWGAGLSSSPLANCSSSPVCKSHGTPYIATVVGHSDSGPMWRSYLIIAPVEYLMSKHSQWSTVYPRLGQLEALNRLVRLARVSGTSMVVDASVQFSNWWVPVTHTIKSLNSTTECVSYQSVGFERSEESVSSSAGPTRGFLSRACSKKWVQRSSTWPAVPKASDWITFSESHELTFTKENVVNCSTQLRMILGQQISFKTL